MREEVAQCGEREGGLRSSRLGREDAVASVAGEFDRGAPKRCLPDPCGTFEPERERIPFEEAGDPFELGFPPDDVLRYRPSFAYCHSSASLPERTPEAPIRQADSRVVRPRVARVWGFLHFGRP